MKALPIIAVAVLAFVLGVSGRLTAAALSGGIDVHEHGSDDLGHDGSGSDESLLRDLRRVRVAIREARSRAESDALGSSGASEVQPSATGRQPAGPRDEHHRDLYNLFVEYGLETEFRKSVDPTPTRPLSLSLSEYRKRGGVGVDPVLMSEPGDDVQVRISELNRALSSPLRNGDFSFLLFRAGDEFAVSVGKQTDILAFDPREAAADVALHLGYTAPHRREMPGYERVTDETFAKLVTFKNQQLEDYWSDLYRLWDLTTSAVDSGRATRLDVQEISGVIGRGDSVYVFERGVDDELDLLCDQFGRSFARVSAAAWRLAER